jgi:hypothetical protein
MARRYKLSFTRDEELDTRGWKYVGLAVDDFTEGSQLDRELWAAETEGDTDKIRDLQFLRGHRGGALTPTCMTLQSFTPSTALAHTSPSTECGGALLSVRYRSKARLPAGSLEDFAGRGTRPARLGQWPYCRMAP